MTRAFPVDFKRRARPHTILSLIDPENEVRSPTKLFRTSKAVGELS
jgi:hypothetical protein